MARWSADCWLAGRRVEGEMCARVMEGRNGKQLMQTTDEKSMKAADLVFPIIVSLAVRSIIWRTVCVTISEIHTHITYTYLYTHKHTHTTHTHTQTHARTHTHHTHTHTHTRTDGRTDEPTMAIGEIQRVAFRLNSWA